MDYKNTLNLPKTDFPMRADLPKREPQFLERWQKENVYGQIMEARKNGKKWILHQGPPFVNGDAHMGHALNMTLKDIVLKYKNMTGHYSPFVPGWDCHGLPIEHKVSKELGESVTDPIVIRKKCDEFARKYIQVQGDQFQRLGAFGDWANPYRTLDPQFEAQELRGIAMLVEKNLIYEGLRPVLWSFGCRTALAEAEIEYQKKTDIAVYAKFKLTADSAKKFPGQGDVSLLIWTTTPWTLPSNLAVAVSDSPEMVYAIYRAGNERLICLKALAESIPNFATAVVEKDNLKGKDLAGVEYQHPFLDRKGIVSTADFVTAEAGTGLVHIAPGHGPDDYFFGVEHKLPILSPVDDAGALTAEAGVPSLTGVNVFKANPMVVEILREKNALWEAHNFEHDYPYCWRSKTPIVFRAVKQWFIKVDAFRQQALGAIDKVKWIPEWGKNRIRGSVLTRPDWCISRQRTWGVPIPVFYDKDDKPVLNADCVRKFADLVEKEGTNVWFASTDEEMGKKLGLPSGLRKGRDTLDVWIDSGTSHYAVLRTRKELQFPADMYLEGSDQHRGWFQSSLMMSVAMTGEPPYKEVLTNGFVVDGMGKKLSKSAADGKPTDLMTLVNMFGADILRLWVASQDYTTDVPFSEDIFARVADTYRSIRNTLRILLANLYDFDPKKNSVPKEKWTEIDRYIHAKLQDVVKEVCGSYSDYNFSQVYQKVNLFCSQDLSSLYVDVLKDRMYCDGADSTTRRAAQTVMRETAETLCKLLAPILPYTMEETWQFLGNKDSVHVQLMPEAKAETPTAEFSERWKDLLQLRDQVNQTLETMRQEKVIGKSLEAEVEVKHPRIKPSDKALLEELLLVSKVTISEAKDVAISARKAPGQKCARCWKIKDEVGQIKDHPDLCQRCADVVVAIKK